VAALASFKIEDPQTVPQPEGEEPFLIRLPVRVRLSASLPQLVKVLGAIQRANALIDVLAIRIAPTTVQPAASPEAPSNEAAQAPAAGMPTAGSEHVEIELLLSRYLVTGQAQEPPGDEEEAVESASRAVKGKTAVPSASKAAPAKRSTKSTKPAHSDE
jgi:hypothetical protein